MDTEFPPPLLRCVVGGGSQSGKGRSRHQRCKLNQNHTGKLAGGRVRKWRKSRSLRSGSSQLSVPGIQDRGRRGGRNSLELQAETRAIASWVHYCLKFALLGCWGVMQGFVSHNFKGKKKRQRGEDAKIGRGMQG